MPDHPADEFEEAVPAAAALVESMRAFGYSPETAVADLVDNSLSAGASTVTVYFHWAGQDSWIGVADDGKGMNEDELSAAMRPGSSNPRDERAPEDLGRFGLGLKTASFSQCRRLVVTSAAVPSRPSTRTWDLDYVGRTGEWRLLTEPRSEDHRVWQMLCPSGRGTLVLWRQLDRLVDRRGGPVGPLAERHFYAVADSVAEHLRITFHRFLRGAGRVSLMVNGTALRPWDPFLVDSAATQTLGDEHLVYRGAQIGVRSYVLPHINHLTQREYRSAEGPRGWTSQQGFYVYRNRRLIVAGDWLGLGFRQEEATKLVRIQLDLPNTLDDEWQLDVRKSVARPPAALASGLYRIAEVARRGAIQVYRHRGKALERSVGGQVVYAWEQLLRAGKITYRINRRHPLVEALASRPEKTEPLEALLRLVEETVPVPLIILDHATGDARQAEPFEGAGADELRKVLAGVAAALRESGLETIEIIRRLSLMEPFSQYPEVIAEMVRLEPT